MSSLNENSMDDFKGLRVTDQLDDDDDDDGFKQTTVEPINKDKYDDDDDDDDEEDNEPVMLGFVQSPRYSWSTLRQMLPSLAGGVPVLCYNIFPFHKTECQQLRGVALTQKQKVARKSLWKEYVLFNVKESEYDTEMSEDDEIAKLLVSKREVDDQMKSLMNDFEGDTEKKTLVNFQKRIAKAPAQVLRYAQSYDAKPLWPIKSLNLRFPIANIVVVLFVLNFR